MNTWELLKNLFMKKKLNINDVATFGNLVRIPKRDDFCDDDDNIKVNEYKETIVDILKQDKTITSKMLHFRDFQEEIEMNLELLMNISFNEEIEILSEEEKRVRSLIIYAKLKLYLCKIKELEKEIKYNYIAIDELKRDLLRNVKIKFLINRKQTISEEENNLLGILLVLMNQKYAIYHKVNACLTEFKTINIHEDDIKSNYLDMRLHKLREYANVLLIDDGSMFDDIVIQIASLEREFEIYAYNHKNDVESMRETVKEYDLKQNFNEFDLRKLEIKFRVLDEFGKDTVTMEDLYNLYKLKFNYMVSNIYSAPCSKFLNIDDERRDFTEYSIYGQIVMEILENILMDKDNILTSQFDTKKDDFWKLFKKILKSSNFEIDDGMYDVNTILTNNLVLSFLIATYHKDLFNFFHEFMVKAPSYMISLIDIEKNITLETFIKIYNIVNNIYYIDPVSVKEIEKSNQNEDFIKYYPTLHSLASIYPMIYKEAKESSEDIRLDRYHLPEGIVRLCRIQRPALIAHFIDRLVEPGTNKYVYTPKSLRELNTSTFDSTIMAELVLNEGLKKLLIDKQSNLIITHGLVIPSTLEIKKDNEWLIGKSIAIENEKKSLWGFNLEFLDEIHFTNFRESIILNDKKYLKEIFSKVIVKENTFRCNLERIVLWDGEYNDFKSYIYGINCDEMQKIIGEVASKHPKVYHNALEKNYEVGTFIDLVVDKFISSIYKKSGFMLCDKNKSKVKK